MWSAMMVMWCDVMWSAMMYSGDLIMMYNDLPWCTVICHDVQRCDVTWCDLSWCTVICHDVPWWYDVQRSAMMYRESTLGPSCLITTPFYYMRTIRQRRFAQPMIFMEFVDLLLSVWASSPLVQKQKGTALIVWKFPWKFSGSTRGLGKTHGGG